MTKSDTKTTKKPQDFSSTPSRPQGNSKRFWKQKKKKSSPEWEKRRREDRIVVERLHDLGYRKGGENNNFPCFCGDRPDEHCVWWLAHNNKKGNHLFCLRCTKRCYEHEIKDTLKKLFEVWKARKLHEYESDELDISKLLSK